jgi:predicted transcriptional regulator
MSELFTEKAFWFMAALVLSLVAVIYRLFNGSLQKDLKIQKSDLKSELIKYFEVKFATDISDLKTKFSEVKSELESFKRHEDNNSKMQVKLLNKLLKKLDKKDPNIFDDIMED